LHTGIRLADHERLAKLRSTQVARCGRVGRSMKQRLVLLAWQVLICASFWITLQTLS
jgi:hypothetical protein